MNKFFKYTSLAACLAVGMTSCSSDTLLEGEDGLVQVKVGTTITVNDRDMTRTTIEDKTQATLSGVGKSETL